MMREPLVVPGHPVDNPPTDDYWPQLGPDLEPVFHPDDGVPLGPFRAREARWLGTTERPDTGEPPIPEPLVAVTDSRVVVLGPIGAGAPPDRRLITQFRHVCCQSIEWEFGHALGQQSIILGGITREGDDDPVQMALALLFPRATDVRSLAQDLLHRIARQYLRKDLVDPDALVGGTETERDYLSSLAHGGLDASEKETTVPFPRCRFLRHGDDYRAGGPGIREQMVHAELSS